MRTIGIDIGSFKDVSYYVIAEFKHGQIYILEHKEMTAEQVSRLIDRLHFINSLMDMSFVDKKVMILNDINSILDVRINDFNIDYPTLNYKFGNRQ